MNNFNPTAISQDENAFDLLFVILQVFFILRRWRLETSRESLRLLKKTGYLCQGFVSFTSYGNKNVLAIMVAEGPYSGAHLVDHKCGWEHR